MPSDVSQSIRELTTVRKRAGDLTLRIRHDVDALADVHHELADLLSAVGTLATTASPPTSTAALRSTPTADSSPQIDAGRLPTRLIRIDAVAGRLGLSRSQVWRMVKESRFPKPRRLSTRAVAWLEADVNRWISSRPVFDGPAQPPPRARRRRAVSPDR